jgi:hypothetical protein
MTDLRYTVVYGNTVSELCQMVNLALEKGYLLQGGICPHPENKPGYFQAMVAPAEKKK